MVVCWRRARSEERERSRLRRSGCSLRHERPPEPGLSGGWTWADSKPVVTTGAEIQTAACPGATVALAGGDRTLSQLAVDSLRTARCLQFLAGTLPRCPRTTYRRGWAGVNR